MDITIQFLNDLEKAKQFQETAVQLYGILRNKTLVRTVYELENIISKKDYWEDFKFAGEFCCKIENNKILFYYKNYNNTFELNIESIFEYLRKATTSEINRIKSFIEKNNNSTIM